MNHRCRLLSSTLPPAAGAICGKSGDPFGFQSARRLDCIGEPKRRKRRPQALSRALGLSVDDPPPSVHKAGIARGNPIGDHIQTRTRAASLCSSASSNCSPKSPGIRAAIRSLGLTQFGHPQPVDPMEAASKVPALLLFLTLPPGTAPSTRLQIVPGVKNSHL